VQQAASDFGTAVFQHGEAITVVDSPMATLSTLFDEPDGNTALGSEPSQFAEQFVSGHLFRNMSILRRRQTSLYEERVEARNDRPSFLRNPTSPLSSP
jgi:hypothetical protein